MVVSKAAARLRFYLLQFGISDVERGEDKTEGCNKLDEHVEGWAHGVLERVSNLKVASEWQRQRRKVTEAILPCRP